MTPGRRTTADHPVGPGAGPRRWAARLLLSQAVIFGVVTLLLVVAARRDPTAWISLPIACYTGLTSLLLVAVAGWLRRSGWARGPGAVLECLQVLTGCWAWLAGAPVVGGPIAAMGLTGVVLLLVPYGERR